MFKIEILSHICTTTNKCLLCMCTFNYSHLLMLRGDIKITLKAEIGYVLKISQKKYKVIIN